MKKLMRSKGVAVVMAVLAIAAIAYAVMKSMPQKIDTKVINEKTNKVTTVKVGPNAVFPLMDAAGNKLWKALELKCMKCAKTEKEKKVGGKVVYIADDQKGTKEWKCPICGAPIVP